MANSRQRQARFSAVGNRDGLVNRVVKAIEGQILNGRLVVGTRLPSEQEFSETLVVGRPLVREAVRILTARGLLETRHGVGATVRSVGCNEIAVLTLFLRTRGQTVDIAHLHQVRSILEVESAGLAAEKGTKEDIQELAAIYAQMGAAAADSEEFALTDYQFHRRLSEMTHNPLLSLPLDTVHEMMAEVRALIGNEQGAVRMRDADSPVNHGICRRQRRARRSPGNARASGDRHEHSSRTDREVEDMRTIDEFNRFRRGSETGALFPLGPRPSSERMHPDESREDWLTAKAK